MTTSAGKRILILGSGFGGLTAANLLRRNLSPEHRIVVVDKKEFFMMGLVNLWILSGIRRLEDSQVALNKLENKEITFLNDEVTAIDVFQKSIRTRSNNKLEYFTSGGNHPVEVTRSLKKLSYHMFEKYLKNDAITKQAADL